MLFNFLSIPTYHESYLSEETQEKHPVAMVNMELSRQGDVQCHAMPNLKQDHFRVMIPEPPYA